MKTGHVEYINVLRDEHALFDGSYLWRRLAGTRVGRPSNGVIVIVEDDIAVRLHHELRALVGIGRPQDFVVRVQDQVAIALHIELRGSVSVGVGRPADPDAVLVENHVSIVLHVEVYGFVGRPQLVPCVQRVAARECVAAATCATAHDLFAAAAEGIGFLDL